MANDNQRLNHCHVERITKTTEISQPKPHQHDYYEIYFLHSGARQVFINNEMYALEENSLYVAPPKSFHKTEGGAYSRTIVTVSGEQLDGAQLQILDQLAKARVSLVGDRYLQIINDLLAECVSVQLSATEPVLKNERVLQIFKTILTFLSMQENPPVPPLSTGAHAKRLKKNISAEILHIAHYINTNYADKITLDFLCKKFLISKTALNVKFKQVMQCTVVDYLLTVRLNRAKYLLTNTRRTMEEISQACGFSSANYFGLIFKRKLGRTPSSFSHKKKHRKSGATPPRQIKENIQKTKKR